MNVRTIDWKQKLAVLLKVKRPKDYSKNASQATVDRYFLRLKTYHEVWDDFNKLLLEELGKPINGHWFVEVGNVWFWASDDGTASGVIDNVILGSQVSSPKMWEIALETERHESGETNTLFLDALTLLQWSQTHCTVKYGEYKKLC